MPKAARGIFRALGASLGISRVDTLGVGELGVSSRMPELEGASHDGTCEGARVMLGPTGAMQALTRASNGV